jgi:hypothetical protein
MRRTILILEDSEERIVAFTRAVVTLGSEYSLKLWQDAPTMISECVGCLGDACLISLDYQLARRPDFKGDPGNGLQVAEFLCNEKPVCPVIIHTSAYDRRWSMYDALSSAKWNVHVIAPLAPYWIRDSWTALAKQLI